MNFRKRKERRKRVAICAEIVFDRGKIVKGEGFQVLNERMKTIDADAKEIYNFLGVEQADGIKMKEVYKRVKEGISRMYEHHNKNRIKR